jgi:3-oxoadipate enol-lactonase
VTRPAMDSAGSGDCAVVFVHGIGGGRAIWRDSLAAMAAHGWRAVAIDLPGYGDTSGVPTMAAMAQALADTLAGLDARRVAVVGHSMGGMIAQELQATRSGLAHALVLACTSPAFGRAEGDWQARFVAERLAPLDAGRGMAAVAAQLVPAMVAPETDAAARERAQAVMARVPEATYRAALQAIVAFDRRAALPAIGVPVLCLAGEHDRTAPPAVMERMAARIPGAEYACLAGAGHIANVERPQAFNDTVAAFLKRQGF